MLEILHTDSLCMQNKFASMENYEKQQQKEKILCKYLA